MIRHDSPTSKKLGAWGHYGISIKLAISIRVAEIALVVLALTFNNIPKLCWARLKGDKEQSLVLFGETIAEIAETLGPVFIKVAQMFGYRRDLFPEPLLRPLVRLQDRVNPPVAKTLRQTVENSLGRPIEDVFSFFEETPIACGSIAAVCRAVTRKGNRPVAVKVVKPGIQAIINRDIECIGALLRVVARSGTLAGIPILETFDTISHALREQADMTVEAINYRTFRDNLKGFDIAVPAIDFALNRREVLVLELIEDAVSIASPDLPEAIFRSACNHLLDALFSMIFLHGFVHCDFHPGNFLVKSEGQAVLLDAGLVVRLTDNDRKGFRDFFMAFVSRDASGCMRSIIDSATVQPQTIDKRMLRNDVTQLLDAYHGKRAGEFLVAGFVFRVFEIQRTHKLYGAPGFVAAIWALAMFEGIVRERYPDLDFQRAARPYLASTVVENIRLFIG